MVAIVAPEAADAVRAVLERGGETVVTLGKVVPLAAGAEQVQISGTLNLA
jgi:hypothetical protein